jgi:hypothetical protein
MSAASVTGGGPEVKPERMPRPVLFAIDDQVRAAEALRDDLSRRFGEDFRVVCESPATAGATAVRLVHEYLAAQPAGRPIPPALLGETAAGA